MFRFVVFLWFKLRNLGFACHVCCHWTGNVLHCAKTVGLLEHQLLTMHCTGTSHVYSVFAQQLDAIFEFGWIYSRSCHVQGCRFKKNGCSSMCFQICFRLFLQLHSWQMKARHRSCWCCEDMKILSRISKRHDQDLQPRQGAWHEHSPTAALKHAPQKLFWPQAKPRNASF